MIGIYVSYLSGNDRSDSYPMTFYGVAGTQATKISANSVVVFKMDNLHPIKRKTKDDKDEESDDDESEDEDDENDPEKEPRLKVAALKHQGCINRIRFKNIGNLIFKIEVDLILSYRFNQNIPSGV